MRRRRTERSGPDFRAISPPRQGDATAETMCVRGGTEYGLVNGDQTRAAADQAQGLFLADQVISSPVGPRLPPVHQLLYDPGSRRRGALALKPMRLRADFGTCRWKDLVDRGQRTHPETLERITRRWCGASGGNRETGPSNAPRTPGWEGLSYCSLENLSDAVEAAFLYSALASLWQPKLAG